MHSSVQGDEMATFQDVPAINITEALSDKDLQLKLAQHLRYGEVQNILNELRNSESKGLDKKPKSDEAASTPAPSTEKQSSNSSSSQKQGVASLDMPYGKLGGESSDIESAIIGNEETDPATENPQAPGAWAEQGSNEAESQEESDEAQAKIDLANEIDPHKEARKIRKIIKKENKNSAYNDLYIFSCQDFFSRLLFAGKKI